LVELGQLLPRARDLIGIVHENLQIDVDLLARRRVSSGWMTGFVAGNPNDRLDGVEVDMEIFRCWQRQ
jgi:hypothetical protein